MQAELFQLLFCQLPWIEFCLMLSTKMSEMLLCQHLRNWRDVCLWLYKQTSKCNCRWDRFNNTLRVYAHVRDIAKRKHTFGEQFGAIVSTTVSSASYCFFPTPEPISNRKPLLYPHCPSAIICCAIIHTYRHTTVAWCLSVIVRHFQLPLIFYSAPQHTRKKNSVDFSCWC